ncbi:hypothetical protein SKAU_G00420660 [Synaphobranchus kaupii]|uniref:Uncharacterized protein n=1 Tax=Synaphobranchus kaupii TaxID=118154 RepID=A0A9Q1E6J9_SYNKA|nr:hypothetical protein SKAU_G00420660 [Synaphobranchus kaupii]
MSGSQVREAMRKLGSSSEECSRLSAALSCLRSATASGGVVDGVPWISEPSCRDSAPLDQLTCPPRTPRAHSPASSVPATPLNAYALPFGVSATPPADVLPDPFPWHAATPPVTPPLRRHAQLKPARTPPPSLTQAAPPPAQHHPDPQQEPRVSAGQPHRRHARQQVR